MLTWKSRHCRWSTLALSLAGAVGASGVPGGAHAQVQIAAPGAPASPVAVQDEEQELYLEVVLNSVATGQLSRFVKKPGTAATGLHASTETLKQIGLKLPESSRGTADGLVALSEMTGLKVEFDSVRQRLSLVAPLDLIDAAMVRFGARLDPQARIDPATRVPGLVVNYDLFAQQGAGQESVSAFTEARVFGVGPGVYSNTMLSRTDSNAAGVRTNRNVRLDTSWQRDFVDEALSLTVGDVITGAVSWSRATRIGGVRLSSNFALQPYRVTTPLAAFQGSAVLPSTVDLFINGLKQSTQTVQPGQFQLNGVPSLGGAGQAQMVITDLNGQSRTVIFDLYGAPQLLDAGLADWSLDLGSVRRNYGTESFAYNGILASATGRYGLTSATTLEAHAEVGSGVVQGGTGGVWLLPQQAGVLSASVAGSHQSVASAVAMKAPVNGLQHAAGYQWNSQQFTLSLNTLRRSLGFRDVASLVGELPARGSDSAYFGISAGKWGQFGFNVIRQSYFNAAPARFAGLGWTYALPGNANLNLSVNRNIDDPNGSTFYLSWSMPLERNLNVAVTARRSGTANSLSLDAVRSPAGDAGGWGWRVQAGLGDTNTVQAQLSELGRYGQWTAGISQLSGQQGSPSSRTVYGSASGGLVWMEGGVYASRRVDEAFALISTSGVAGVPVRLENRVIGETDARGMLFVTQLNAYQKNQISIDTLDLPADMRISRQSLDAVPESRSGMLLSFGLRRIVSVQVSLQDGAGEWVAAGSQVAVDTPAARGSGAATVVGYDGLVYLEDPPADAALRVRLAGSECTALLPAIVQRNGLVDLGVLRCF